MREPPAPARPPVVVANRVVRVGVSRTCEVRCIEDAAGVRDIWLRVQTGDHLTVSQFRIRPGDLRPLADALNALAGEIGAAP